MNLETQLIPLLEQIYLNGISDGEGSIPETTFSETLADIVAILPVDCPTETLPVEPAQYLFAISDSPFDLWTLTEHGWFTGGVHYDSPLARKPYTTWQRVVRGSK